MLGPLLVYRAHRVSESRPNPLERLVREATRPVQVLLTRSVGWISDVWYGYVDVLDAQAELSQLRIEQAALRRRVEKLDAAEAENRVLRGLLELEALLPESELVSARVIGAGSGPEARTLVIDRGRVHGVEQGLAVLSREGLVGVVQLASWTSSEVALLTDPRVTLLVECARTGARGRLRGDGEKRPVVEDVPRADGLSSGDQLVSSGLGGVLPPGLPVGSVEGVENDARRPLLKGRVSVHAPLGRLRALSVLRAPSRAAPAATPLSQQPPPLWGDEE
ncbi:MAG: rod shape-determining protein MreC [Myxococcota bacterium]